MDDQDEVSFEEAGLLGSRGWIGGYEMDIAFPPDRTGRSTSDHRGQHVTLDGPLVEEGGARTMSPPPSRFVAID